MQTHDQVVKYGPFLTRSRLRTIFQALQGEGLRDDEEEQDDGHSGAAVVDRVSNPGLRDEGAVLGAVGVHPHVRGRTVTKHALKYLRRVPQSLIYRILIGSYLIPDICYQLWLSY